MAFLNFYDRQSKGTIVKKVNSKKSGYCIKNNASIDTIAAKRKLT